jgi:hypothetical protein
VVLTYLFTAVDPLVVAVIVHYLYRGARPRAETCATGQNPPVCAGRRVRPAKAAATLGPVRHRLLPRGVVRTGASYADVNAILRPRSSGGHRRSSFLRGAIRRNMLPAVGFGLLVLSWRC